MVNQIGARRHRRMAPGAPPVDPATATWTSMAPQPSLEAKVLAREARRAIDDLPDRQRRATYLRLIEGWGYRDIDVLLSGDAVMTSDGVLVRRSEGEVTSTNRVHVDRGVRKVRLVLDDTPVTAHGQRVTYESDGCLVRLVQTAALAVLLALLLRWAGTPVVIAVLGAPVLLIGGWTAWRRLHRRRQRRHRPEETGP